MKAIDKCQQIADDIFQDLGSGFDESVYQRAFEVALRIESITYENQRTISIFYKGFYVGEGRIDIIPTIAGEQIIVELKAVASEFSPKEVTQLKKYMELTHISRGLLINFPQADRKGNKDAPQFIVV